MKLLAESILDQGCPKNESYVNYFYICNSRKKNILMKIWHRQLGHLNLGDLEDSIKNGYFNGREFSVKDFCN